jgi:hypothetical protein
VEKAFNRTFREMVVPRDKDIEILIVTMVYGKINSRLHAGSGVMTSLQVEIFRCFPLSYYNETCMGIYRNDFKIVTTTFFQV